MITDASKLDHLTERLGVLVKKKYRFLRHDWAEERLLTLDCAFRHADPAMLVQVLRDYGDTNRSTTRVEYLKLLEALDFDQFADFAMPSQGRTFAFARQRGCVLAVLNVEPDRPPYLELIVRSLRNGAFGYLGGFPNDIGPFSSKAAKAHRIAFDGTTGLLVKLYHLDRSTTLSEAWWSLGDDRTVLPMVVIGKELVTKRERYLCDDYNAILRLADERTDSVPSTYRFQFDADHRFTLADVLSRT